MTAIATVAFNRSGFVLETTAIPQGYLRRLEDDGTIHLGSRTVHGAYVEPGVPLSQVVARFARAGIDVRDVRPAGLTGRGVARSAVEARRRLRSPHAAEWLPTLPAA
jgi:hypothetical protein